MAQPKLARGPLSKSNFANDLPGARTALPTPADLVQLRVRLTIRNRKLREDRPASRTLFRDHIAHQHVVFRQRAWLLHPVAASIRRLWARMQWPHSSTVRFLGSILIEPAQMCLESVSLDTESESWTLPSLVAISTATNALWLSHCAFLALATMYVS